ncbi:MAG: hypothetical protein ACK4K9_01655 [Bacteroidia bacterium]
MKKTLLIIAGFISLSVSAQKSKVESAAIYLRNNEIEEARTAIEQAVQHPDTKNDAKAWFYYVSVYDSIGRNKKFNQIVNEPNLVEKFHEGCKKCIEFDVKNRYSYYCKEQAIINSAFMAFNKGIESYEAKDYDGALKYYQMVIDVLPYDKNGDLRKNNLAESNVVLYMAYAAIQGDKRTKAKELINKLMNLNYDDPVIYIQMIVMNLEDGDTTAALSYIDKAKVKFPTNKDIINTELNIYLSQGKQDILLEKLNAAIESDPYTATLYFVRGNVYDNYAASEYKKAKTIRDAVTGLRKKALTEKDPAKKQMLNKQANDKQNEENQLNKRGMEFTKKAEADYAKVIELEPSNIDAYFNLGAITNNKTTDIAERINNITAATQAEYDKKYKPLKTQLDSILNIALGYFNEALALAEQKPEDNDENKKIKKAYLNDILFSLQQVYANLGDEKKTIEVKKRRESL